MDCSCPHTHTPTCKVSSGVICAWIIIRVRKTSAVSARCNTRYAALHESVGHFRKKWNLKLWVQIHFGILYFAFSMNHKQNWSQKRGETICHLVYKLLNFQPCSFPTNLAVWELATTEEKNHISQAKGNFVHILIWINGKKLEMVLHLHSALFCRNLKGHSDKVTDLPSIMLQWSHWSCETFRSSWVYCNNFQFVKVRGITYHS